MKTTLQITVALALAAMAASFQPPLKGAETAPRITTFNSPEAGEMEILFHGDAGPFQIQKRLTLGTVDQWLNITNATITELQPGIFLGHIPKGPEDLSFYRVVSHSDGIADIKGWTILLAVSPPANGQYFVAGESPVVTVTILDNFAQGLTRESFSTLNLYLYGPQDPQQTVTAAKLLNASTDRTVHPNYYIDLKTNPNAQVNGTILTYPLQPITAEAPGTYTVSLWCSLASDPLQQLMKFANIQIGSATAENPVVDKTHCAACHEGPISGKMYLHHNWPGYSPTGNWSLDYEPVTSCKSCHNNDGYASYKDASGTRTPDPIVRRVHGVHMGSQLTLPFDNDPTTGDFRGFNYVQFPADVRNCTACHVDDRWQTQISRMACGACHDSTWFGPKSSVPTGQVAHKGGPQPDDSNCDICHGQTSDINVAAVHQVNPPAFQDGVGLSMTPPANGKFYVAGEAPAVTIQITNLTTGALIDPKTIVEPLVSTNVQPNEWRRANLFVSGPRAHTVPVLTTAAANASTNQYYAENDFRVRLNSTEEDPRVTRTATSVVYHLSDVSGLAPGTYTAFVEVMPNKPLGGWAYANFQVGAATPEPMVASNCADCHGDTRMHASYFAVTFTPDICKSCHDYERQMPGKTSWSDANFGFGAAPLARRVHGVHYGNYLSKPSEVSKQVDYSHVIFPMDVRNCTKCHAQTDTWTAKPSRLACLACHDTDDAQTHAALMTYDPTPQDPWSGDEVETCDVCHGADDAFSPKIVHAISNPYVPPYPRNLRGN